MDVASPERHRRLTLDLVLERALEDINDLLAWVRVLAERHARSELDAHLNNLASGDAEVMPLEVSALDARLVGRRHQEWQTASDNQCAAVAIRVVVMCPVPQFDTVGRRTTRLTLRVVRRPTTRYRSGLNAARSSDTKSAGSSHAAKCPPRSTSLK